MHFNDVDPTELSPNKQTSYFVCLLDFISAFLSQIRQNIYCKLCKACYQLYTLLICYFLFSDKDSYEYLY